MGKTLRNLLPSRPIIQPQPQPQPQRISALAATFQ